MITHIVIFTWIAEATAVQVKTFGVALDMLASDLAELAEIRHGPDLRFRTGNGDYALVATFKDRAGWNAYQAHPKHKAFVRDLVTPMQASRIAIQI